MQDSISLFNSYLVRIIRVPFVCYKTALNGIERDIDDFRSRRNLKQQSKGITAFERDKLPEICDKSLRLVLYLLQQRFLSFLIETLGV